MGICFINTNRQTCPQHSRLMPILRDYKPDYRSIIASNISVSGILHKGNLINGWLLRLFIGQNLIVSINSPVCCPRRFKDKDSSLPSCEVNNK